MMAFKTERGRRRAGPLGFALLGVIFHGVWSFVLSQRLPGLDRPRSVRPAVEGAVEEKLGTRLANGTSPIKEEITQILQRYAESGDISDMQSSYQKMLDSGTTLSAGLYNKALEAIATAGRPADAKAFLAFMEKQVQPDGSTYDNLVTSYINANDHENALKTLFAAPKVLLKTCKRMLRSLLEVKKDFKSATRLMSCLPAMGLQPSYPMYKGMVAAAAEEGNLETAEAWFQQLKADGLQPDSGLLVSLVKGAYKAKDSQSALRYFNFIQGADLKPTKGAFGFLIRALAADKEVDTAASWMDRMAEEGFDPDLEIYEAVLEAAAKSGRREMRRDLEQSWITKLKVAKVKVNKEVFKTIIRVAARYGDTSAAADWLKKMKEAGHTCGVNEYNYLLKGSEYLEDPDTAQKFFNRMEKAGVKPDAESYNLVIKTMAKAGKPKLAEKWTKRMEKAGLLSSKSLQLGLVAKSIAKNRDIAADYAAGWVQRAIELKKPLGAPSYRAVMRAYLEEKNYSQARQWFEWMEQNGTAADYETYTMLMRYDDRKTAFWHQKMEDAGIPPTTESFNLVIRSFGDAKGSTRLEETEEWYERMLNAGVAPDQETFAQLIAASVKSRDGDTDRWFSKMVDSGISPDASVYKSMMMRSLLDRDPVGVRQILDWMVLKGISIHKGAYNIAIRAFAEANDPEKAEEIFDRLRVAGRFPDERSYSFLIEARAREGSMDKARAWFNQMLKDQIRPGFRSYAALIQGYATQGDVTATKEFLEDLKLRKFHGIRRAAWMDMMVPAVQCLKQAGEDEAVAKWTDYSADRGFELSEVEEAGAEEASTTEEKQSKPSRKSRKPRKVDEVDPIKALEALKAAGETPDIRDFNKVMAQFASAPRSRFSMAKAFLETTIIPAVQPNEKTFQELLRCNRRGDGKRGVFTIEWMSEKGFAVKRSHTNLVVRQLLRDLADEKVSNIDSLLERVLACLEKGARSAVYDAVIREAAEVKLLKVAEDWANRARDEGQLFPQKTCYNMAKAYFKDGDEISSLWWIERAGGKEKGSTRLTRFGRFVDTVTALRSRGDDYSPRTSERVSVGLVDRIAAFFSRLSLDSTISKEDVPYLNIMQAYSRAKRPQGAADWLDKMAASGTPPVEAYNTVIRSYAEVGDIDAASKWLARLQAEGKPDLDSYQAVIDAYASNGDAKKVDMIWKELKAAGFLATDQTYCSMLRAHCIAKDAENVEVWVSRFEWEGIQFNWLAFSELVRFYLEQGELAKALQLSEEMAMTDLFDIGSGPWIEQLQAAQRQSDTAHAEKVASAMLTHGYSLDGEAKGLLKEMLGEDFQAFVKLKAKA